MNIFEKALNKSKSGKKMIGIRMYGDDSNFWCGYILDFNKELILFQHFSKAGLPDGIVVEKIENVESLDVDDFYNETFQRLTANHKVKNYLISKLPKSKNWAYKILSTFCGKNEIISAKTEEDFSVDGRIIEVDQEFVKIEAINSIGMIEGFTIYRLKDIKSIHAGSLESWKRSELLKTQKK